MSLLYNFFILLFSFAVRVASPFNLKARQWVSGRKDIFKKIRAAIDQDEKIIWFHCASLGEFEQGRPVIEKIKSTFSNYKILLTFFSPSGYEVRKNFSQADYVFYLPADTPSNAMKFVEITKPSLVFFIKYEFWFNYINVLSENKIPLFVVSAIFRPSQHFFKPWGYWSIKQLQKITHFFVQNEESVELLNKAGIYHVEISGDTRFDRVIRLAEEPWENILISQFVQHNICLVAGSTWPADEDILKEMMKMAKSDFKLIIAPHVVSHEHLIEIIEKFKAFNPVLFSDTKKLSDVHCRVLIIDSIGTLAYLYRYARIAYVGGGFGAGIHNVLEAATYGLPVIFGPNYKKFNEAVQLAGQGGGFPVQNANDTIRIFNTLMHNEDAYQKASVIAKNYVKLNGGATSKVISKAREYLFD